VANGAVSSRTAANAVWRSMRRPSVDAFA
jgi:hypothetical protein